MFRKLLISNFSSKRAFGGMDGMGGSHMIMKDTT
jgi:hypothetical protein